VVLGVLRASKRTLAGSEPKKRLQDKGPDMKNEDSTCLTLTRSYRIEPAPGTLAMTLFTCGRSRNRVASPRSCPWDPQLIWQDLLLTTQRRP